MALAEEVVTGENPTHCNFQGCVRTEPTLSTKTLWHGIWRSNLWLFCERERLYRRNMSRRSLLSASWSSVSLHIWRGNIKDTQIPNFASLREAWKVNPRALYHHKSHSIGEQRITEPGESTQMKGFLFCPVFMYQMPTFILITKLKESTNCSSYF